MLLTAPLVLCMESFGVRLGFRQHSFVASFAGEWKVRSRATTIIPCEAVSGAA